jgi:hypothetical protein
MSTPLNDAHAAAMRVGPRQAVTALINCHGSRDGSLTDVPPERHGALIKALLGMANATPREFQMTQAAFSGQPPTPSAPTLDDVRRDAMEAFGSPIAEHPAAPVALDPAAIFKKWNRPNGKTLGDEA